MPALFPAVSDHNNSSLFRLVEKNKTPLETDGVFLVSWTGFEPTTVRLEGGSSIQLSYQDSTYIYSRNPHFIQDLHAFLHAKDMPCFLPSESCGNIIRQKIQGEDVGWIKNIKEIL